MTTQTIRIAHPHRVRASRSALRVRPSAHAAATPPRAPVRTASLPSFVAFAAPAGPRRASQAARFGAR